MADQSDVEKALAGAIGAALYPEGPSAPSTLGRAVRIYRGWPLTEALDRDLANGTVNVTIFPEAHRQANTTRWNDAVICPGTVSPTLTLTVAGERVAVGGVASPGQLAGVMADTLAVVHRIVPGDTTGSVAAVLGANLRTQRPVQVAGATLMVPGVGRLIARVVADQGALRELRRQRQSFRVTCWCPDPDIRDLVGSAVDSALSAQGFIGLPDGTAGRVGFVSSALFDERRDAALFRRDLVYAVEYATTAVELRPSMIFGNATFSTANGGVAQSLLG